jgi:hypothetical protein
MLLCVKQIGWFVFCRHEIRASLIDIGYTALSGIFEPVGRNTPVVREDWKFS